MTCDKFAQELAKRSDSGQSFIWGFLAGIAHDYNADNNVKKS